MTNKELEEITNIVKKKIEIEDKVVPQHYYLLFMEALKEKEYEYFCRERLNDNDQEVFYKRNGELAKNAHLAIDAIEHKDTKKLNQVLEESILLEEQIKKLQKELITDNLTKAYNRQWLFDKVVDHNKKFKEEYVVVLIDLNDFKDINDNYGHIVGDKTLTFLVRHLKGTGAEVVRFGGDEFLLFFQNKDLKESISCVIKNRNILNKQKILYEKDKSFKFSYSFGASLVNTSDNFEEVMNMLDKNMYIDKESQKNKR